MPEPAWRPRPAADRKPSASLTAVRVTASARPGIAAATGPLTRPVLAGAGRACAVRPGQQDRSPARGRLGPGGREQASRGLPPVLAGPRHPAGDQAGDQRGGERRAAPSRHAGERSLLADTRWFAIAIEPGRVGVDQFLATRERIAP